MSGRSTPEHSEIGVYCDETGISGHRFYGFGSLWIPWQRRGDLAHILRRIRQRYFDQEMKWTGVKKSTLPMYRDLVEEFFARKWMAFHCLLVSRSDVNKKLHRSMEEAMQKHYTMLLENKISRSAKKAPNRRFYIRVDDLPFGYEKSDEVMAIVLNHLSNSEFGQGLVASVRGVSSKGTAGIQLCDILLGAVASAWQRKDSAPAKKELRQLIAAHLGWPDLEADTRPEERKFNIWHFYDPTVSANRRSETRAVKLTSFPSAFAP